MKFCVVEVLFIYVSIVFRPSRYDRVVTQILCTNELNYEPNIL